jgi:hypothetical protein
MGETASRPSIWQRIRRVHWGEACLWALFVVSGVGGASDSSGHAVTFSGISALAAIGVRATRPDPREASNVAE